MPSSRIKRLATILLLATIGPIYGQSVYISGQQNGTLQADTIYLSGDVIINASDSLIFLPGSKIISTGHFGFEVKGYLMAKGERNNPISFTIADTAGFANFQNERGGWQGFHFNEANTNTDSTLFEYCFISFTKALRDSVNKYGGAFNIRNQSKIRIQNCTFRNNYARLWGGAIFCESANVIIDSCLFENNFCGEITPPYGYGGAICFRYSNPKITNSIFHNNQSTGIGGAASFEFSDALVHNNLFTENRSGLGGALGYIRSQPINSVANNIFFRNSCDFFGGAVAFLRSNPHFIHNTLIENSSDSYGGGIYCNDSAAPVIINSIVYSNSAAVGQEVYIWDIYSAPVFYNSNIKGGKEAFGGTGGTGYSAEYINNIDTEPNLIQTPPYYCMLMEDSPCIDSGTLAFSGPAYPSCDFVGNPRVSGENPDMGAFEFKSNLGEDEILNYYCFLAYPNPFHNLVKIKSRQPMLSSVTIQILKMNGTLIREIKVPVGSDEFIWDGKDTAGAYVTSGIYIFRIKSNNSIINLKVIRSLGAFK
ncbi:MAG: T9SS type A sorting domain-containing protein [Lentimicrobium sp.]|nr:T9SS type A sorting domain-containing protein [Lentimicrobium sp.]